MYTYKNNPEETLSRIADICPRCMSAYLIVINRINSEDSSEIAFTKDEILKNYCRSWTKFRNDLRVLASFDILNLFEENDILQVEIEQ